MARFCTHCGTAADEIARFCEECGKPMKAAPSPAAASATRGRRVTPVIAGVGIALLAAAGGALYWMLPEQPSEANFRRAIAHYFATHAAQADALLCLGNLSYSQQTQRVSSYNDRQKQWMDALVQSGIYGEPRVMRSGTYFVQTDYLYPMTDAGKLALRQQRLCLGDSLHVKSVAGFDRVWEEKGRRVALARAQLVIDEASWLRKSPARADILHKSGKQEIAFVNRLVQVDGKWEVDTKPTDYSAFGEIAKATPEAPSLLAKLKQWFSFGAHPLVGKWGDASGIAAFEFTRDEMIENGRHIKARFETSGDDVKVIPLENPQRAFTISMLDKNTCTLDLGLIKMKMQRIE